MEYKVTAIFGINIKDFHLMKLRFNLYVCSFRFYVMSYAKQTIANSSWIKKFSHLKRFEVATRLITPSEGTRILDFGTGDGYLLHCLEREAPKASIWGYEPVESMYTQLSSAIANISDMNIHIVKDLNALNKAQFDVISCCEVLEHFSPQNQKMHLKTMLSHLKSEGKLVISVPLEIGWPSLFKNGIRILIKQQHSLTSLKTIWRAFLGKPIARKNDFYINSHLGFNHKDLEQIFDAFSLQIEKKLYSPFPLFYGFLNSQVFYVLKKHPS